MHDEIAPKRAATSDDGPAVLPDGGARRVTATRRRRRRGRIVLSVLLVLLLVLAALGYGVYRHLNGNLTSFDLPSDVQGSGQLQGLPDGVAENIVVIGTDSRQNADDCKLGGSCGTAKLDGDTNADVVMVVHIAADHKSMSVLSIPRDTTIDLPACSGNGKTQKAHRDRINGTLNYGTDCTMRTIHNLTGLNIDHFMMVDFSGVITLSQAVGGVEVCVNNDVYDTYSHLKLKKGKHSLEGVSALQFLRTRHGFGDGSDLGRTVGQHLFLSSLQREMESTGTLLNPSKVYHLADAATKALIVDKGLASVSTLTQVASTVGGIPASSTAFVTLPTQPNPNNPNTVVPAPAAKAIFQKMAADVPLATASSSKPSASASSTAASSPSSETPSPAASSATPTINTSSSAPSAAATNGQAQVSSESTGCAPVSTEDTVEYGGHVMNPTEAYRKATSIPDSAP